MAAMERSFRVSVREILASEPLFWVGIALLGCLSTGRLFSPIPVIMGRLIRMWLFLTIFLGMLLRISENVLFIC